MPDTQPNVVILMTDQQRADFCAGEGFGIDTMPFLDSLRPRGVWFSRAYTPHPVCAPARVSMLNGRWAQAHGVIANWPGALAPRQNTDLVQVLRARGYEMALFGKNHSHARREDFDAWRPYNHTQGVPRAGHEAEDAAFDRWMTQLAHWISPEPTPFPVECQYPVRIVDDALAWLRQPRGRPFFAWVSFPEPHSPYQVPEPYFSLFPPDEIPERAAGPEALALKNHQWRCQHRAITHYHPDADALWRRCRASYCGMLRLIDDQVRRLVQGMEQQGLLENTIFVYLADHGEFCGDYGLFRKGLALPQCAIRIPMFWFGGPVRPHAGSLPAHVSLCDVFPTLCEAIGETIPAGVQGRSLWPLLTSPPPTPPNSGELAGAEFSSIYCEHGIGGRVLPEEAMGFGDATDTVFIDGVARTNFDGTRVATSGFRRAVVKGRWKLVYDPDLPADLYDLERDPHELRNLAADAGTAAVRAEMMEELLYWSVRTSDNAHVRRFTPAMPPHNWWR